MVFTKTLRLCFSPTLKAGPSPSACPPAQEPHGKGSQWLSGGAASGDGGELLQEGFLAECVEGQVPPDVCTYGSNLGRAREGGRAEEERTVRY